MRTQRPKVKTINEAQEAALTFIDLEVTLEKGLKREKVRKKKENLRRMQRKKKHHSYSSSFDLDSSNSSDSMFDYDSSDDSSSSSFDDLISKGK